MSGRLTPPVNERDHIAGSDHALVTLVEFGDYECPYCGRAHRVVKALKERLGDDLRVVFRHFPLASAHPRALVAAEVAESAGAQGHFWPMHETLYAHQDALEIHDLARYAADLDLDLDQMAQDLDTHRFLDKIRGDLRSGALSGVNGTPTFFINGHRHDGNWSFDSLWSAIARAAQAHPSP